MARLEEALQDEKALHRKPQRFQKVVEPLSGMTCLQMLELLVYAYIDHKY